MSDPVIATPIGVPLAERWDRMQQQARASRTPRTWAGCGCVWRVRGAWVAANKVAALPADHVRVAKFRSGMSAICRLSTVRRYLAVTSVSHTPKGECVGRKQQSVKTILRGAARGAPAPRIVRPRLAKQVKAHLNDMGKGAVDRAKHR